MSKGKYYVVWVGREPGIYRSWDACKRQVDKFPSARYKSFKTKEEAEQAYANGNNSSTPPVKKTKSKKLKPLQAKQEKSQPNQELEQPSAHNLEYQIYCDGACDPNPGEAGSGVAVYKFGEPIELWYGLYNPNGTNNTAELNAFNQALSMAEEIINKTNKPVQILSDSQYSINCITKWAQGWEKKGWVRKGNKEILNLEIIQECYDIYNRIKPQLIVNHVKGHDGIEGNELADRMSVLGAESQEEEFCLYREPINVDDILAMKRG